MSPKPPDKTGLPWHVGDASDYLDPHASPPNALGTSSAPPVTLSVQEDSVEETEPYIVDDDLYVDELPSEWAQLTVAGA